MMGQKRGGLAAPFQLFHSTARSEGELRHQRDRTRVAGENCLRVVENRVARGQIVQVAGAVWSGEEGCDVIDAESLSRIASWNVLRVIEQVCELSAKTELEALREVDLFIRRKRQVVGGPSRKRIAPGRRQRACACDDVLGGGVG